MGYVAQDAQCVRAARGPLRIVHALLGVGGHQIVLASGLDTREPSGGLLIPEQAIEGERGFHVLIDAPVRPAETAPRRMEHDHVGAFDRGDVCGYPLGRDVLALGVEEPEPAHHGVDGTHSRGAAGGRVHPGRVGALTGQQSVGGIADEPVGQERVELEVVPDAAHRQGEATSGCAVEDDQRFIVQHRGQIMDLCERYAQAGRLADAVAVRRDHFGARRTLAAYQQLRAAARAANCWPAERGGALALLRADAQRRQQGWYGRPVLVDALLDDKDADAAWQAAAQTGAHDRQWLTLADEARAPRPADALGVYLRLAEPLTKQTGNTVYEQLVGLQLSIRDCHRRLGTEDEFAVYVTALRTAQRRKRNLMRLMDEHGL